MKRLLSSLFVALALPLAAHAQEVTSIKVEPAQAEKGKPVKVTAVTTQKEGFGINCGLRINFGDGKSEDFKITKAEMLNLTVEHTYANAGTYEVWTEGKRVTSHLACPGKKQKTSVTITEPPKPVAAAASGPGAGGPGCPNGWKMQGKPHKKTGAFTCGAKAGTAAPDAKPACPGDLTYFENTKKGQLGCRP